MSLMIQLAWQFLVSWVTTASSLPPKINLLWTGTSTTLSWKALVSPQQNSAKLKTFWICCHTSWARQLQGLILGNPAAARFKSSLALQCFKARRSSLELLDFHSSKPHQALKKHPPVHLQETVQLKPIDALYKGDFIACVSLWPLAE